MKRNRRQPSLGINHLSKKWYKKPPVRQHWGFLLWRPIVDAHYPLPISSVSYTQNKIKYFHYFLINAAFLHFFEIFTHQLVIKYQGITPVVQCIQIAEQFLVNCFLLIRWTFFLKLHNKYTGSHTSWKNLSNKPNMLNLVLVNRMDIRKNGV